jgi:hypothetical protein
MNTPDAGEKFAMRQPGKGAFFIMSRCPERSRIASAIRGVIVDESTRTFSAWIEHI